MGSPRRIRSYLVAPRQPWVKERIDQELSLIGEFGLRSKKELYAASSILRKMRAAARSYLALPIEDRASRERELISRLHKLGLVEENASLDDVLSLDIRAILSRRLQSIVRAKGLANSLHESRQLIVHGMIKVGGRVVKNPSRLVTRTEDSEVTSKKGQAKTGATGTESSGVQS